MAYKLIVTQKAHQDLDDVLGYIARKLANPKAAANLLDQVEKCYGQLCRFPFLYECCQDTRLKEMGYRKTVIGNYVLVFRPVEQEQTVYVLRFFYGGQDYPKQL